MKYLLTILITLMGMPLFSAESSELFIHEPTNQLFAPLDELDSVVSATGHNYYIVNRHLPQLTENVDNSIQASVFAPKSNCPPWNIHPFIWGCAFGFIGILIVHLSCHDWYEVRKSIYGLQVHIILAALILAATLD